MRFDVRKVVFLAVLITVFAGGVYLLFSRDSAIRNKLPELILGNNTEAGLFAIQNNALVQKNSFGEHSALSRVRRADLLSAITVVKPNGQIGDKLLLETKQDNRLLDVPLSVKDTPALSFDGSLVAYAELALPIVEFLDSALVRDWRVRLVDLESGEVRDLGVGYRPFFISESPQVLAFSSPEGLTAVVLESEERIILPHLPVEDVSQSMHVSLTGSYLVAYNSATKHYGVYAITDPISFEIQALGEVPDTLEHIAISEGTIYGIRRDVTTGLLILVSYEIKDFVPPRYIGMPNIVFTFPETAVPRHIIP